MLTKSRQNQLSTQFVQINNSNDSNSNFRGCQFIARARGNSMANSIKRNDLVGLIQVDQWEAFIPFGEVYGILTHNGDFMIKKIIHGEDQESFTLLSDPLESEKEYYQPQQIKKASIKALFQVRFTSRLF